MQVAASRKPFLLLPKLWYFIVQKTIVLPFTKD